MIKFIVFDWNALACLEAGPYLDLFHAMAVRECQIMEAGYNLVKDLDGQVSYVELKDDLEAVEFKLRFF